MTAPRRWALRLSASAEGRDQAVDAVSEGCRSACAGLTEVASRRFEDEVLSALAEALSNVAVHAYRDAPADSALELEVEVEPGSLTLRVKDWGHAFDIGQISRPNLKSLPESGMGMFIIKKCMDEVGYTPGEPNVLTLTKRVGKTKGRS